MNKGAEVEFLTGEQLVTLTQLEVKRANPDTRSASPVALPDSIHSSLYRVGAWITMALDTGICYSST